MTFTRIIAFICVTVFSCSFSMAEPTALNEKDIYKAAGTYLTLRFPYQGQTKIQTTSAVGNSNFLVDTVEQIIEGNETIGYIAHLKPDGYILMRGDRHCPPIKIYYDKGDFWKLPPDYIKVIRWELKQEYDCVKATTWNISSQTKVYKKQWRALLNPQKGDSVLKTFANAGTKAGPILTTNWNQNSPYNWYSPAATGGPGGRAYAGCVATAMAQIMRFYQSPAAISSNYTYTDNSGSCTGTHSASDVGLDPYDWSNMPASIGPASTTAQKQAVGKLIYHAGVTVDMDFEADGSGAYSSIVDNRLRDYFDYTCSNLRYRSNYTNAQWYNMILQDINESQPVYYSMQSSGGGHAIVCDGARNGNEIHLNFGWSGSCDNWYNMDSVVCNGTWYNHDGIFDINPTCVPPGTPSNLTAFISGTNQVTLTWTPGTPTGVGYNVYRGDGSCPGTNIIQIASEVSNTSYIDSNATGFATYSYYVSAYNLGGASGFCESSPSNCADATIQAVPALFSTSIVLILVLYTFVFIRSLVMSQSKAD